MNKGVLLKALVGLSVALAWVLPVWHVQPPALQADGPPVAAGIPADWWVAARQHLSAGDSAPTGLSPTYDWSAESNQADAQFGWSVASAGDINGDDYDDVIVGAWQYDSGAVNSGRAYLFYGSETGLSTTPDRIIEPPKVEYQGFFGVVVGTAGNVNGDEYDDIMVAMTNYDLVYGDEGAVYVWYGSDTGIGASPDWFARGNSTYAHLGWDAGTAGDVNGDGCDEIIAGAYRYDTVGASNAYVWYGSPSGLGANGTPANADWTASSDQTLAGFGTHVGSAGDVNCDGIGDVYVGAPDYDHGESNEGMVFIWYGSDPGGLGANGTPSNADWTAESDQANGAFSGRWSSAPPRGGVGSAGDVNGDSCDDFLAGSNMYDNPDGDEGAVFLWYGSASGLGDNGTPANADWSAEGNQVSAWLASGAGTAGDVNGDGYDDVLVGACFYDQTPPDNQGLALVWLGSSSGLGANGTPDNADWSVASGQTNAYLGYSLATAGDVNGDGYADVIAGAYAYDNPEANEGRAFVYHGHPDLKRVYLPIVLRAYP
jgi:hypothetical protein